MYTDEGVPLVNGVSNSHDEVKEQLKPEDSVAGDVPTADPPAPTVTAPAAVIDSEKKAYRPSLSGLPHELRVQIMQHLRKISDLYRVSLVCKFLRDAAVPLLYKRLTLTLGGPQDTQIQNTLSPRNPGLRGVKHLKIRVDRELSKTVWKEMTKYDSSEDADDADPEGFYHSGAQAQVMLGMILELLPRDQLLALNWNTWDVLTTENWAKMYSTQRNIKQIEIGPLEGSCTEAVKKRPDIFKNLNSPTGLFIWPNSLEALELGQIALQDLAGSVDNLLLNCVGLRSVRDPASPLMDSSTTAGLINRTLFKHMMPFDRCTPLKLRELYVTDMELHHASTTLLKAINFNVLESLILDDCKGAGNVFAEMCKAYARPTGLRRICWLDGARRDVDQNDAQTFEEWLQSFKGLQYIHIDIGNPSEPIKPLAIKTHADSLRSLFIRFGMGNSNSVKYSSSQVEEITERCTKIRQLSIPLPEMEARSGKSFEEEDVKRQIAATRQLPELETLCIQDWPASNLSDNEWKAPDNLAYYNQQLSQIATKIFVQADAHAVKNRAPATRSKLSQIAFGTSHWSLYDPSASVPTKLQQALFMRGELIDPFGARRLCAVQVEKGRLREIGHEDESVVGWDSGPVFKDLDYVLYKN